MKPISRGAKEKECINSHQSSRGDDSCNLKGVTHTESFDLLISSLGLRSVDLMAWTSPRVDGWGTIRIRCRRLGPLVRGRTVNLKKWTVGDGDQIWTLPLSEVGREDINPVTPCISDPEIHPSNSRMESWRPTQSSQRSLSCRVQRDGLLIMVRGRSFHQRANSLAIPGGRAPSMAAGWFVVSL